VSQIYRALDEIRELVDLENGVARLSSEKIKQDVAAMVDRLNEVLASTADRVAELCDIELRSSADSAFQRWLSKYGVAVEELDKEALSGTIRIDTVLSTFRSTAEPRLRDVLQKGLDAWTSTGRDPRLFKNLEFVAKEIDGADDRGRVRAVIGW